MTPIEPNRARLRLRFGSVELSLIAAYLGVPYPSGLHRLLAREPRLEAVVVDRIPPGLADAAAADGIALLDRAGYGRVVRPGFVYVATSPRRPASLALSRRSPFAPKASRVVRMFLAQPGRWRLSTIAETVDMDPGNAHRILATLLDTGMVERDEDDYLVTDPGSLLEAWAEFTRWPGQQIQIPLSRTLEATVLELLDLLEGAGAISGEFAAERWAPYLPAQSALIHCYRAETWERLTEDVGAPSLGTRRSHEGQLLLAQADEGVAHFGEVVDGFPLVHPAQAYVDLYPARGRGREAAEHLRRECLPY